MMLVIAFGTCTFKGAYNIAAVLEWIIAFVFTFYVGSYFIDLVPVLWFAKPKGDKEGSIEPEMQMEQNDGQNDPLAQNHAREGTGFRSLEGRNIVSADSQRTLVQTAGSPNWSQPRREEMTSARNP
jgi:hypothetical protein